MKLFKNTLLIIALFAIGSASAKTRTTPTATRPTPTVKEALALPGRDFAYYILSVRDMLQKDVINKQGVFTEKFENFVKSSGLAPEFMQALLEAGRNLHLPLSGDDEKNIETIMYTQERIDAFMDSLKPEPLTPTTGAIVPYQASELSEKKTKAKNFLEKAKKQSPTFTNV